MTQSSANISAQQVKLSVYELNSLTAHPLITVQCADYLSAGLYENASICLSSDPAASLAVINFCRQQNVPADGQTADFTSLLKQLSKKELIKTLLTLDIYNPEDPAILSFINPQNIRNGTRAYAAKLIAEKAGTGEQTTAFNAAVFADVGLFALAQLFTKSILMLRQESIEQNIPFCNLQQENLGITDNILSQMLLQKWQLGDSIADTGWLFKTKATALIDRLPGGKIISIVRLADMLCDSEEPDDFLYLVQKLSLTNSDITEIKEKVRIFAEQINALLGLDAENPPQFYSETIKQIYLNQLTAKAGTGEEFEAFVREFTNNIKLQARLIDVAVISAKAICKIFSAKNICVFIALQGLPKSFLTAVIKDGSDVKTAITESPEIVQANNFLPIRSGKEVIGGIIRTGASFDNKQLGLISDFIAKTASIINRKEEQESIAQTAVECLGQIKIQTIDSRIRGNDAPPHPSTSLRTRVAGAKYNLLAETVAEIAAGAAHELNNPLAVISGRAQLLWQSEPDETKKTVLNQISDKARDIHEIVGQLMNYARPPKPQIRPVSPFIVLNNALEKANARYLSEPLDIKLENIETLDDVEVDGEQVAEAIAQIIYNALESYESGSGPVKIIGKEQNESIEIQICDSGCGMSEETLQKASQPFFSDKSAGRQRGMGLSLAESYLKNNGCTLKIESKLQKGTMVTIILPKAKNN